MAGSVRDVTMRWREKLLFEGGAPGRPAILVDGDGADEVKARRAIDLSLEKYCSVVASLAPDTRITYDVALR